MLWKGFIAVSKGGLQEGEERIFFRDYSDSTRDNGFLIMKGGLKLDIRKILFMMRVVRYWNILSREAVDTASLEMFESRLDGCLSNLT